VEGRQSRAQRQAMDANGRNIFRLADFQWEDFETQRTRRSLNLPHLQHADGTPDIAQNCQPAQIRNDLVQEFEALAGKVGNLDRQTGDVAAGSRQTRDQAGSDRITCHPFALAARNTSGAWPSVAL